MNLPFPPFSMPSKSEKLSAARLRSFIFAALLLVFLLLAFVTADPMLGELSAALSIICGLLAISQPNPPTKNKG